MIFRVGRTLRVVLLTIVFAVAFPFRRLFGETAGPRLLRWYFQTCQAAFIKIGQLLAVRYDLLPAEYCRELAKLFDQVPAVDFEIVKATVQADLGLPIEDCYASIQRESIASASIAQVHYATLHNGHEVAVKVMRPGVRQQFSVDLANAHLFARIVDFFALLGAIRVSPIAAELGRMVSEELDFRKEARNTQLLHDLMEADDIDHYAPRIYFRLSGRHVITQERLKGVWISELLDAVSHGDSLKLQVWASQGISPVRAGRLLFRSVMEQCYRHRVFHADPHAGNLVILWDGALGFIDFGSVGWLDESLWAKQRRVFDNIARRNVHGTYEALIGTLEPFEDRDLSELENEVKELFWEWIVTADDPRATPLEKSNGRLLLQVADAVRRSGLRMPWRLIRVYRAQIVTDMIVYTLFPRMNPVEELTEFFNDEIGRNVREELSTANLERTAFSTFRAVRAIPEVVSALTDWLTTKLPILGRTFGEDMSRFERGMTYMISFAKSASWIAALATVLLRLIRSRSATAAHWSAGWVVFDEIWWLIALGFCIAGFLFSRVVWHIRYPGD